MVRIPGTKSNQHRSIAFPECAENKRIDARKTFDALNPKARRDVLARFDFWIDGNHRDNYFHGWPNDEERKACFVFKWKQQGSNHRLYGFLMNPMPNTNPSFQVCVLVSHARKSEHLTDPREVNTANALREDSEVVNAVKRAFPDGNRNV